MGALTEMNESEKIRRKKVWDSFSKEKQEALNLERFCIIEKYQNLAENIIKKLKETNQLPSGLDNEPIELIENNRQYNKAMQDFLSRIFNNTTNQE